MLNIINQMRIFLISLLAIAASCIGYADQNSPKLDQLFQDLYQSNDVTTHNNIVDKIWLEWMTIEDEEIQIIMDSMQYFFQGKDYTQAIKALDYAIEKNPQYSESYNKRATFFYFMGEYEKSMQDIQATLALEPRHFGALDGMARILIEYKMYSQAQKVYDEMKLLMPNDVTLDMKIDRLTRLMNGDV
jgi:tetratricopeptide (TPR) repeat protein